MKKWKWDRIISVATLASSLIAIVLVLKKPHPVAPPMPAAVAAAKAESFQEKVEQFEQPKQPGQAPSEVHLSSDEITAAFAQAAGMISGAQPQPQQPASGSNLPNAAPTSADAPFGPGQPEVKDYQVNFDGDVARGQFVTQIGGKDVYVTLAGHLGSKDGYATFDPTEFKVGDLSIPVALVNDALQKRLTEQRDRLKLPDNVDGIKVENGELVMTGK
ncbi:MAG TPA: hypothetical protein VK763_16140 [Terriglobales bacterium]|jgi:hypothetical protein|nr:hypothetical protein [Terriglobales bacterium]